MHLSSYRVKKTVKIGLLLFVILCQSVLLLAYKFDFDSAKLTYVLNLPVVVFITIIVVEMLPIWQRRE